MHEWLQVTNYEAHGTDEVIAKTIELDLKAGLDVLEGAEGKQLNCFEAVKILLNRLTFNGDSNEVRRAIAILQWAQFDLRQLGEVKTIYERIIAGEEEIDGVSQELLDLLAKLQMTMPSAELYALILEHAPEMHPLATYQLSNTSSPLLA